MKKKVLVAEDNPLNMKLVRDLLEMAGHEVVEAENGALAVDLARKEQPDLVLMDLRMPEMDGLEATRILKADEATAAIPIVALSASVMQGDEQKALDAGCDDFLSKPFDVPAFRKMLERFLG